MKAKEGGELLPELAERMDQDSRIKYNKFHVKKIELAERDYEE